ncbi:unnamed protein product, partial [Amoebophrya sp. A120]|eukprot:GSA120T00008399001.1
MPSMSFSNLFRTAALLALGVTETRHQVSAGNVVIPKAVASRPAGATRDDEVNPPKDNFTSFPQEFKFFSQLPAYVTNHPSVVAELLNKKPALISRWTTIKNISNVVPPSLHEDPAIVKTAIKAGVFREKDWENLVQTNSVLLKDVAITDLAIEKKW